MVRRQVYYVLLAAIVILIAILRTELGARGAAKMVLFAAVAAMTANLLIAIVETLVVRGVVRGLRGDVSFWAVVTILYLGDLVAFDGQVGIRRLLLSPSASEWHLWSRVVFDCAAAAVVGGLIYFGLCVKQRVAVAGAFAWFIVRVIATAVAPHNFLVG